jgi:hypothetical protein
MTTDIAFTVLLAFLVVVLLAWRTHVPLVIYATCAGFVLSTTWGPELSLQLGKLSDFFISDGGYAVIGVLLFLLPAILTAHQFKGTMSQRLLQQFIPALFWVIFASVFTLKFLPVDARQSLLESSTILTQLNSLSSWTVLLAVGVASIELLAQNGKLTLGKKGKKDKE